MEFEAQIDRVASNLEFERSRDTQSKLLCLSLITFHNILIDILFNVGGVVSIVNSKIWRTYGIVSQSAWTVPKEAQVQIPLRSHFYTFS